MAAAEQDQEILDVIEEATDAIRAQMLRCGCGCGCRHVLYSGLSKFTLRCRSCRSELHAPPEAG